MHSQLSKNEFLAALRHGRGRAFLHVEQVGLGKVADAVLDACLTNQAYDSQCEPSRAPWLYSMFKDSPEYSRFSSAIFSALESEAESYDSQQLAELCLPMAKGGDAAAGAALRARVLRQPFAGWETFGCHELVALDGTIAVVELARRFGRWLIANPEEMVPSLEYLTDELDIRPQAEARLQELAETDDAIRAYLDREHAEAVRGQNAEELTKEQRYERVRDRSRKENPIQAILGDAARGVGKYPGRYMQFGRYATEPELREVLARLTTETEENALVRLLWIFRRASLPELLPRIFALAESGNESVRHAAMAALAQNRDPRIGDLGRAKLCAPDFSEKDAEVLGLLVRNWRPGDEMLIMSALHRISPNDDNAHDFGHHILKLTDDDNSPAFTGMLRWVYETNPCTICRSHAVERLASNGGISPEIISECLHDACEETQQIARQAM